MNDENYFASPGEIPAGTENAAVQSAAEACALLPPDTPSYHYEGPQTLDLIRMEKINTSSTDSVVVVTSVPPSLFREHGDSLPGRVDYYTLSGTLILTMASRPHEIAADEFGTAVAVAAIDSNIKRKLGSFASTGVETAHRIHEADRSWGPCRQARPTVALEVGYYSQTGPRLERNMAW